MALKHREHMDLVVQNSIDNAIPAFDQLSNILSMKLRYLSAWEGSSHCTR